MYYPAQQNTAFEIHPSVGVQQQAWPPTVAQGAVPAYAMQQVQTPQIPAFYGNVAGSPAFTYANRPWPKVFGILPEVEAVLVQINTAIREGKLRADMFPADEQVAQGIQAETGPRADLLKREMFTTDTVQLVKYIAQIYLHCKYMGKLEYPQTPMQAVQFAVTALYTEYGMLKGVRGESPTVEQQQLRSLQYLWGHIGGFIMLTHFPVGWDSNNAIQRKASGFDVLVKTAPEPPRPSLWMAAQQGHQAPQMQGVPWAQQTATAPSIGADWAHRGMVTTPDHSPTPGLELYTNSSIVVNGEVGIDPRGRRLARNTAPAQVPVQEVEMEVGIDPRGKRPPKEEAQTAVTVRPKAKVVPAPVEVHDQGFSTAHWNVVPTLPKVDVEPEEIDFSNLQLVDEVDEPSIVPTVDVPEVTVIEAPAKLHSASSELNIERTLSAIEKALVMLEGSRAAAKLPKLMGFTKPMPR